MASLAFSKPFACYTCAGKNHGWLSPSRKGAKIPSRLKPCLTSIPTRRALLMVIVRAAAEDEESCIAEPLLPSERKRVPSRIGTIFRRFYRVATPYWSSEDKVQARIRLVTVFALTLATTGISVGFNFLGRDFYNSIASKDQEEFSKNLLYYLGAFIAGIPVFVFRDYSKDTLSLRWRAWMTKYYLGRYFENRAFYNIQAQSLVDNPDQRVVDDLSSFTSTALGFSLAVFNATIDLISFSGILYSIYPPLFGILIVYSIGGTAISLGLGKSLVNLNFMQEKKEADFRYGLVRVRENAESIAFYEGEQNEIQLLLSRFKQTFDNYSQLLVASRNLQFFQSGYRYVIQVLPAAVVAPLYFSGKIDFGVINQSFSAFNHILGDFSLIIYQFQSLSAFSAVIDRLGEFSDILDERANNNSSTPASRSSIELVDTSELDPDVLLEVDHLTLMTPQYTLTLIENLSFRITRGQNLLVMGASGSGKTSLLRAIAGLWKSGQGTIRRYSFSNQNSSNGSVLQSDSVSSETDIFFLPQRPYMVLGSLRQQLLYPTWDVDNGNASGDSSLLTCTFDKERASTPGDNELLQVVAKVKMERLLDRCDGLDSYADWASVLSLGEQQRLAFARLLLSKPRLVLLDESTSALDEETEFYLYGLLRTSGVSVVSVGHRSSLRQFHSHLLKLESRKDDQSTPGWSFQELKRFGPLAIDMSE